MRHDKYCAVYFLQNAFFHLDPVGFCRLSPLDYTQLHVSPFCIQILTETATVHYINCDLTHFLNSNSFLRSREMALYLSYQLCVCVTLVCVCVCVWTWTFRGLLSMWLRGAVTACSHASRCFIPQWSFGSSLCSLVCSNLTIALGHCTKGLEICQHRTRVQERGTIHV